VIRIKNGRVGRFEYTLNNDVEVELMKQVFQKMGLVPLRVECLYARDCFEVIGHSDYFDLDVHGEMSPEYLLTVTSDLDGDLVDLFVDRRDGKETRRLT